MSSNECRPKDDVDCPSKPPTTEKCLHQPDGFYPDYDDDCASYYRHAMKLGSHSEIQSSFSNCSLSRLKKPTNAKETPYGIPATGSCGSGKHVVCLPPSCLGLRKGYYPLPGSACTAYYSCNDGFRTDMLCPFGSIFDYKKKQCVSGMDSVCYERACENRVNGLYSSPQASCGTFYKCFNGAMVQLEECPLGQIFDGLTCVFKTNFSCWKYSDHEHCGNRHDGYYASGDADCRGFFFCKDQIKLRSFLCDKGMVFNGEKCVHSRNRTCSPRPPLPDCSNKLDGYYTLDKTNCKRFYRCKNEKKLSEHKCPNDHVFNGHHCVNPLFHTCNLKKIGIERSLPDNGVYPNYKQEY
ncbi:hypothetical protein Avbf_07940 [Armadillidium vulgare]|nr:hypothetical protein Avbf_07940 [Armadillidium vulgare]